MVLDWGLVGQSRTFGTKRQYCYSSSREVGQGKVEPGEEWDPLELLLVYGLGPALVLEVL